MVECEGAIRSPFLLQEMVSAGMRNARRTKTGAQPSNAILSEGSGSDGSTSSSVLWAALTRLSDDSLIITKSSEGCHVLLVSQAVAKDGDGKRVPMCKVGSVQNENDTRDVRDVITFGRMESWEMLEREVQNMAADSVRFIMCTESIRGLLMGTTGARDLHLCCPPLMPGQYSFHGEARGFDSCAYKSNMELTLEEGGTVIGIERGHVLRGREVSGKISNGCWGSDGTMELDYIFEDGTIFTYKGCIESESHKFEGRWFAKDFGWEGSDENNRGWFAFEVYRNGWPQHEATVIEGSTAASLRSFLEVLFLDKRANLSLMGSTLKAKEIKDTLYGCKAYECALGGGAAQGSNIKVTLGRSTEPGFSGFFIYVNKRLVIPSAVVRSQRQGKASRIVGVVEADFLAQPAGMDTLYASSSSWESFEKVFEHKINEYVQTEGIPAAEVVVSEVKSSSTMEDVPAQTKSAEEVNQVTSREPDVIVVHDKESQPSSLHGTRTGTPLDDGDGDDSECAFMPEASQVPFTSQSSHVPSTTDNSQAARCRVNNGKLGWRCKGAAVPGHTMCMYHICKKTSRTRKPTAPTLAVTRAPRRRVADGPEAGFLKLGDRVIVFDVQGGLQPLAALSMRDMKTMCAP